MIQEKTYRLNKNVRTPVVINTPFPHKPTAIKYKEFREGETVTGVVQERNGQAAFVVVKRRYVIPMEALTELVTKSTSPVSMASGQEAGDELEKFAKGGNPKVKYLDAAIIGAVVGVSAVWFAQKRGWIVPPDKKNLGYGAALGAGLCIYAIYRIRNRSNKKK